MSLIKAAAASGALAIALGAFGAHGLKSKVDPAMLKTWETASHYHLAHSAALLAMATNSSALTKRAAKVAPPLMVAGICLFSGSLYLMVLTNKKALGAITPIGGLMLIGGWLALAL
mmetsp:Transcript_44667/g.109001  ORF Transcript_44667/g.109001 Transcript_44667/m.109001 type:complete len:116 (+) Transcript_44667:52-399(+)|eukprot:CAMPEP_0206229074 /NCGR_PEP_ID=MMETSP0047_2-20121206/9501_1 /ASSEMBLY_ACC=CAM_ASM_000192 /TAXON_ID=195065 /ORGANISM="Chroomonas mesostigmatica_cf, Strain CCMP1168" /LENGTH=115 /DNA_ID=CAMNT_0053652345 /DNA_START=68 /DNA_END=415 /DNA_ORIENTATION=+